MLRLVLLVVLLLASAPQADAQLGGLLNRARRAVTGASEAAADAKDTASGAAVQAASATSGASTDVDAVSPATRDGRPAPVIDFSRFLHKKYWPLRGMYHLSEGKDHLIFPPEGLDGYADHHGTYVIRSADGREVASQELGIIQQTQSAAFVTLGTRSGPSGVETLEAGDYLLDLVFQGQVAGRMPFSISVHPNGDPFNPQTVYRRHGLWSELAYFEHQTDEPEGQLTFTAWVSFDDLGTDDGRVRFTLYRDGEPVAASRKHLAPHVATQGDWDSATTYLATYASRDDTNSTFFTIEDMTPGSYVMRVTNMESDETIREYAFEGGSGTIVPHERSAMDYEPRHSYLSPRNIQGQSLNRLHSVFWVDATE